MSDMFDRDPKTGEILFPVHVNVHVAGGLMPLMIGCKSWPAAIRYLGSAEFREVRDRVTFVTITDRRN